MTRNSDEIDAMLARVREVWIRHPYMRLGQLVANGAKFGPDVTVHLIEDESLLHAIEDVHTWPASTPRSAAPVQPKPTTRSPTCRTLL
jgi:hypothetical protein